MADLKDIKYLKHKDINLELWDQAIANSLNGLVYGYSWFLNAMADEQWDALVYKNYEAVFPLVNKKKYGIPFLHQPYFCQQLGLFSTFEISEEFLHLFLQKIPSKFKYWNFHLNYRNVFPLNILKPKKRTTFQINLNQSYTEIYDHYNSDAKKNLAKAEITGFDVRKNLDVELVAHTFFEVYGQHYARPTKLQQQITNCAQEAIKLNKGFTKGIYGKDGQLWCAGFFLKANNTIHYAMAAPTAQGKKYGATHILIDEILKEFAMQNMIFDFEGSDINSVAYFYSKFGSNSIHYLEINVNKLPRWCRWLKK
ncbi:MAG: hypothetical protein HQ463_06730 [Bacteroidetes bacterium]|nr:hypothetical protein [Bacteroidota bacterium]